MTNERLAKTSLRWSCPHPRHSGTARRYVRTKFFTDSGKAQFKMPVYQPPDENVNEEFPLGLTTGRVESQWHTRTRTGKVLQLVRKVPEPFVEIHPDDAIGNDVQDGEWIYLCWVSWPVLCEGAYHRDDSPRVALHAVPLGDLFHAETNANYVTNPAFDPVSKQPELKFCAVRIETDNVS